MQIKTGSGKGKHLIIAFDPKEFDIESIKSKKLWIGKNEHSEISLKAENSYLIVPPSISSTGNRYGYINNSMPIILSKKNIQKLLYAFDNNHTKKRILQRKEDEKSPHTTVVKSKKVLSDDLKSRLIKMLEPVYVKGQRDGVVFGLSGLLLKEGYPIDDVKAFIIQLCDQYNDEQKDQRIRTAFETYDKFLHGEKISGISHIDKIFTNAFEDKFRAVGYLLSLKKILNQEVFPKKTIDDFLPEYIKQELSKHVYKVISIGDSVKLVVAHTVYKKTLFATIERIKSKLEENVIYAIAYGDILIDAIPTTVIIYDNPLDKTRKYKITFSSESSKKPQSIGPATLEDIITELLLKNKILKKGYIHDTLSAIISAYEETGEAIVNDTITIPGYYVIDNKLVTINTNQLPFCLDPLSDSKEVVYTKQHEAVLSCIDLLEELNKKWREPIFSTILKWTCVSQFSYILKQNGGWIPYLYLYGWSNSGKTTLGKICLAVWRKYPSKRSEHLLSFGNIDSIARFGQVVSRDTYPRIINEAGSLSDQRHNHIVEIIKNSIDNTVTRGRIENYRNYMNIPALSPLMFTSNPNPPFDTGFRRRIIPIPFDKNDSKNDYEAKEFEDWLKPRFVQKDRSTFITWRKLRVDSDYWIETNLSAERIYQFCIQATELAGFSTEDWQIEYKQ